MLATLWRQPRQQGKVTRLLPGSQKKARALRAFFMLCSQGNLKFLPLSPEVWVTMLRPVDPQVLRWKGLPAIFPGHHKYQRRYNELPVLAIRCLGQCRIGELWKVLFQELAFG